MKIANFPVIGMLLLLGGTTLSSAAPKTLNPARVPARLMGDDPFRFNGVVTNDDARGSGFCAWSRYVFFSAAHVVFDDEGGKWGEPPVWTSKANSVTLDDSKSIQSRGYYRWTDYSEIVAVDGNNGDAFGRDVILGFSFSKLIQGRPAVLNLNGINDLKKPIRSMITGYPAENFYLGVPINGYFLHRTGPGVTPYKPSSGKALQATLVSTGGGNSGGPVWTKNPDIGWTAAGVLVGGLPSEVTVYAFSSDINALTRAVTPLIRSKLPDSITVGRVSGSSRFFAYNRARVIPDGVQKWTDFPISVDGFEPGETVKKVKLSLKIKTKHQGDLQVILSGPGGFEKLIHNEQGAGKDDLTLVDEDVSEAFTDIDPKGRWILRVQDRLKGDTATLVTFLLEIAAEGTTVVAP